MIRYASGMSVGIFMLLMMTSSAWSQQYYLYAPAAVGGVEQAQGKDGVLVKEVPVKKGDTLTKISRKFSGHGSYYPQILLFNTIKNPNKIYPGNVFKVPVPRKNVPKRMSKAAVKKETAAEPVGDVAKPRNTDASAVQKLVPAALPAVPVTEISTQDLKKVDTGREKKLEAAGTGKKQSKAEKKHAAAVPNSVSGQKLFENAVKAYRQDDYRRALELFDRYLTENKSSPLAADASLYKAECYLKLSTQN